MYKHHLKVATRRLWKHKQLSLVKISGLALSVAVSLLLIQYIDWQWNFDRFQEKGENIVRIQNDIYEAGELKQASALTYTGVPVVAKDELPAVKNYTRLARWIANDVVFQYEAQVVRGKNFFFADPSFFEVFSFELLQGDPKTALQEPNAIVLTEDWAAQLFGDENPIGKSVIFESRRPFVVTGVVENPPTQSHIQFGGLSSLVTMTSWGLDVYDNTHLEYPYTYAYLLLEKETDVPTLAQQLTQTIAQRKATNSVRDVFQLQPLHDIHLYSDLQYEITATGKGNNIWILFGIAVLILLLAWINHFNIATSDVIDQQKMLSLRRIVGAEKKHLLQQVAVSALLSYVLATGIGVALAYGILPFIKQAFGLDMGAFSFWNVEMQSPAFGLAVLFIVGTLGSSALPALLGANTNVLALFQQSVAIGASAIRLRSGLVVIQFAIIIGLLISGIVIYQQLNYMEAQDLGINLDNKIAILGPLGTSNYENMDVHLRQFKQAVAAIPGTSPIAVSRTLPGDDLERLDLTVNTNKQPISLLAQTTDLSFFSLYELSFIAKDSAISNPLATNNQVVINERAMHLMGFQNAEEVLRQKVTFFGDEKEIIGVVEDHHQRSLHYLTEPILYDIPNGEFVTEDGYYSLQLAANVNRKQLIRDIQTAYENAFPQTYFDVIDVEERFAAQYATDQTLKHINQGLIGVSIGIAFIGLIGLFNITLAKRTKEIGIRKVLGASVTNIVTLLSKDFIQLVLVALLIATPIAYYFMNEWLQDFAYRIELQWWVFALAGLAAIGIALLTVSVQSVRAALANPVQLLRSE
ncbi:MAG: ABC transporter permease [Bacteroidota bacterium]